MTRKSWRARVALLVFAVVMITLAAVGVGAHPFGLEGYAEGVLLAVVVLTITDRR